MLLEIRMQIVYMIILELLQNFSDVLWYCGYGGASPYH